MTPAATAAVLLPLRDLHSACPLHLAPLEAHQAAPRSCSLHELAEPLCPQPEPLTLRTTLAQAPLQRARPPPSATAPCSLQPTPLSPLVPRAPLPAAPSSSLATPPVAAHIRLQSNAATSSPSNAGRRCCCPPPPCRALPPVKSDRWRY